METAENSVQAEKKESTKDEPEKVEAEKPPVEKTEQTDKTEKTEQSEKTEKPETPKEEEKKEVVEKCEEPAKVVEEEKEKKEEKTEEKEKVETKTEEAAKVADDNEKCVEKTETTEEVVVEKVVEKVVQQEVEEKVEQVETQKSESVEEKTDQVEEKHEQVEEKHEKVEEKPEVKKEEEQAAEESVEQEKEQAKEEEEVKEEEVKEEVKKDAEVKPVTAVEEKQESESSGSDEELIIEEEEVEEDEEEDEEEATEEEAAVTVTLKPKPAPVEEKPAPVEEKQEPPVVMKSEAEAEDVSVKLQVKEEVREEVVQEKPREQFVEEPVPPRDVPLPYESIKPEPFAYSRPAAPPQESYYARDDRYVPQVQRDYPRVERDIPRFEREYAPIEREVPRVERDIPRFEREYAPFEREVPRVERDIPRFEREHAPFEREVPRVNRDYARLDREPPRVMREEQPRYQHNFPSSYRQGPNFNQTAQLYRKWPPQQQSHLSYETEEIRKTVHETSGLQPGSTRREVYDERYRQEYKSQDGSSEGPKPIDLQKIFTPATDAEEIIPKNRKLYASSAFYSPGLHPTVEDQVELARKISHSLSDSNNQQSKGQSMYVNRKKRSVKWVHEGEGTATIAHEYDEESKENQFENRVSSRSIEKVPLKLVMDPRGQVKSSTLNDYKFDAGMQSPEICADIVKSLHAPKGKGAELFAKRRKKSENWIVDQTNTTNSSSQGMHDQLYGQAPSIPSTGPKDYSPTYDQYQYSQSPYAAVQKSPVPVKSEPYHEKVTKQTKTETIYSTTRDLAYKPSIPRGWNAPEPSLSKGLYTPPVISLDSYAPPPEISIPSTTQPSWAANATVQTSHSPFYPSSSSYSTEPPVQTQAPAPAPAPVQSQQLYSPQPQKTVYSPTMPQGYKRTTPGSSGSFSPPQSNVQHATPSLVFNPSPLPYEKLEKFNRPSSPQAYTPYAYKSTAKASVSPAYPKQKPTPANIYKPQPKYEPYQNESQPTRHTPSNGYATTTSFPCNKSPVYQSFPNEVPSLCTKFSSVDVMHGPTFNTAPRGWNQMRDYYRPVTLDDPKSYSHMAFTDF